MKKLTPIFLLLLVIACVKEDLVDYTFYTPTEIFDKGGVISQDATPIEFNLPQSGEYILSLQDEFTNKVITKESFTGNAGSNALNVYTKIVPKGSYFLTLRDKNGNKVQQTKISI